MIDLATETKQCSKCLVEKDVRLFARDSSIRDGRALDCLDCQNAPRLSMKEHTQRLFEGNYNSEATKRQRWEHQDEYYDEESRWGRAMHHSDLLRGLRGIVSNIYITPGRILGDLAVYKIKREHFVQKDGVIYAAPFDAANPEFEYLFYIPTGWMPEFSQMEFKEDLDIPIREKRRGWRTVLLRLIKSRLITQEQSDHVFGTAEGIASARWRRELWKHRNL